MIGIRLAGLLVLAALCMTPLSAGDDLGASDQALLERLVIAEAGGEGHLGMALVARSVLNRTALLRTRQLDPQTYNANGRTLSSVVNARMQYEPVSSGSINRRRSSAELARARSAIALARDTQALDRELARRGVGASARARLIDSTGFRARGAYNDSSQNYNRQTFRGHVFNADRFSRRLDVRGQFERTYGQGGTVAAATEPSGPVSNGSRGPQVQALQRQLNERGAQLTPDGIFGGNTETALKAFQQSQGLPVTGRLDEATQRALATRRPRTVTQFSSFAQKLRAIMPRLSQAKAELYAPHLERVMAESGISGAQQAAFIAHVAYESCELLVFEDAAKGQCSAGAPLRASMNQLDYARLAKEVLGVDIVRSPVVANSPSIGFKLSAAHWTEVGADAPASSGNFMEAARLARWNETTDLSGRLAYYLRARAVLGSN
ncbi:MAG: peptidoglycan-binding protein [Planctomycetota bacterium]